MTHSSFVQSDADARYGQLAADNSWTQDQSFAKGFSGTGKSDTQQNARDFTGLFAPTADTTDGIILKRPTNTYGVSHTANLLSIIREGANTANINDHVIAHFNEWGGGGAQTWHVRPGTNQPNLATDYPGVLSSGAVLWLESHVDMPLLIIDKGADLGSLTNDYMMIRDLAGPTTFLHVIDTGFMLFRKTAPPADADMAASEVSAPFLDDNTVSPRIRFKSKDSASNPRTNWLPAGTPLRRFEAHAISNTATIKDLGLAPTITTPGTAATFADDLDGAWVIAQTAATTNSVAGFENIAAGPGFYRDWYPEFWCRMRTPATITNTRYWCGMFASTPSGSADPAINGAGFRRDTASDTNWQAWSNDGTSGGTITDTGIAGVAGTAYRFRVIFTLNAIEFYINGKLVATHTTNLPALVTKLFPELEVTTLNNAAKALRFGAYAVECA